MAVGGATSLRVQTVLYRNDTAAVERALVALGRSVELARRAGLLGRVTLAIGDSSSLPCLNGAMLDRLTSGLRAAGVDELTYDFFDANLGSAGGHNRLLAGLVDDLVLIVNPDVVASPVLLPELMLPLSESLVGVVEARQLPLEHPKPFDPISGETPWVTTACALSRASVFERVGGFDAESFFLYCDDVDWSWRVRLAGYRLVFAPAAKVFHDKRIDGDGHLVIGEAMIYYSAEAALFLFHKYARPDLLDHYLAIFLDNEDARPLEARAARAFLARRDEGRLPEPIDDGGRVASFIDGQYARHRF